jgi:hypothetical protein
VRSVLRRALVGAAAGAVLGALVAVVYARVDERRPLETGIVRNDAAPVELQQVVTVALHVVNVVRQILSLAR